MTVKELIEKLMEFDQDLEILVHAEDYDYGPIVQAGLDEHGNVWVSTIKTSWIQE